MNKPFLDLLEKAKAIHQKKNEDYAQQGSPHENFERMASIVQWFKNPQDQVYAGLIALKMARLATLLNKQYEGKGAPNNEPIDDTFLDQFTYTGLWYGNYVDRYKMLLSNEPMYSTYKLGLVTAVCYYCNKPILKDCIIDRNSRLMHHVCVPGN